MHRMGIIFSSRDDLLKLFITGQESSHICYGITFFLLSIYNPLSFRITFQFLKRHIPKRIIKDIFHTDLVITIKSLIRDTGKSNGIAIHRHRIAIICHPVPGRLYSLFYAHLLRDIIITSICHLSVLHKAHMVLMFDRGIICQTCCQPIIIVKRPKSNFYLFIISITCFQSLILRDIAFDCILTALIKSEYNPSGNISISRHTSFALQQRINFPSKRVV